MHTATHQAMLGYVIIPYLGIALDDGHALERVFGARLCQLVRRLVHQHHARRRRARLVSL